LVPGQFWEYLTVWQLFACAFYFDLVLAAHIWNGDFSKDVYEEPERFTLEEIEQREEDAAKENNVEEQSEPSTETKKKRLRVLSPAITLHAPRVGSSSTTSISTDISSN